MNNYINYLHIKSKNTILRYLYVLRNVVKLYKASIKHQCVTYIKLHDEAINK